MFHPATNKKATGGGDSSASESDWDTTVDVPAKGNAAEDEDRTDKSDDNDGDDDDMPVQPRPKTRASLATDKGKEERNSDGAPYGGRGEKSAGAMSPDGKRERQVPASASAVRLSPFESASRDTSPVPPFTHGFQPAVTINNDTKKKKQDSPVSLGKDLKDHPYEMSPTPKIPASMEAALPRWDDSDAEQQTLRDLRSTLKKEKTREQENKAKQIQGGGDNSLSVEYISLSQSMRQPKELDRAADKAAMRITEGALKVHEGKMFGENSPYQPLIVRTPDGKRFVYHFSEGSMAFYEVVEEDSQAVMPDIADKAEVYIRRGWQEFFSLLRIVTSIFVFLAIEAMSFVTNHIARPLVLGLVMNAGNRLVKPVLAALFNVILQPIVILLWNVMSGVRHVSQPVIEILGGLTSKIAVLLQAFRLVEVHHSGNSHLPSQRV